MTQPRSKIVNPEVIRWYHCISRCVRRAFLIAEYQDFDRKAWLDQRHLRSTNRAVRKSRRCWTALDPSCLPSFEGDLHALVLVGAVFEVHRYAVLELKQDQAIVDDFAAPDFRIHDVVEPRIRPPAFFPVSQPLAVTKEVHWGLNREIDGTKRELEIELTDPHLGRELSDYATQVKVCWYPVHSGQSNLSLDGSA
jgi:hypothetical protein